MSGFLFRALCKLAGSYLILGCKQPTDLNETTTAQLSLQILRELQQQLTGYISMCWNKRKKDKVEFVWSLFLWRGVELCVRMLSSLTLNSLTWDANIQKRALNLYENYFPREDLHVTFLQKLQQFCDAFNVNNTPCAYYNFYCKFFRL